MLLSFYFIYHADVVRLRVLIGTSMTQFCTLQAETSFSVGMSSVTLKIGLFYLLVTDCLMCYVMIVDRYKYRWLRRDSLHICNKLPLLSYIF